MYHHVKKLMYTVDVGEADPKFGKMLLEQFGAPTVSWLPRCNIQSRESTAKTQRGKTF
jgi:hypothetical protein